MPWWDVLDGSILVIGFKYLLYILYKILYNNYCIILHNHWVVLSEHKTN